MTQYTTWRYASIVLETRYINPSIRDPLDFYPKFASMMLRFEPRQFPETRLRDCRQLGRSRVVTVTGLLTLVAGSIPERLQQAARVVPRDPLQRGELDVLDSFPRPAPVGFFSLVEADDGFRERVVVRIPVLPTRRRARGPRVPRLMLTRKCAVEGQYPGGVPRSMRCVLRLIIIDLNQESPGRTTLRPARTAAPRRARFPRPRTTRAKLRFLHACFDKLARCRRRGRRHGAPGVRPRAAALRRPRLARDVLPEWFRTLAHCGCGQRVGAESVGKRCSARHNDNDASPFREGVESEQRMTKLLSDGPRDDPLDRDPTDLLRSRKREPRRVSDPTLARTAR